MMYDDEIMEKIDARSNEILTELGKTSMTDSSYGTMTKNLETLCKIKADQETRDQNRLNNNARNELEEVKVRLEEEKLKTQKLGTWLSAIQTGASLGGAALFARIAYKGNLEGMADRSIMDMAKSILNKALTIGRR